MQEKEPKKINNKFWNFCKSNNSKLWLISFCLTIFTTIFLFVMAIMPNNPAYSTTSFIYSNQMYAVKFSSDLSSYIVIFAPAGWVAFFLIIFTITFFVIAFIVNWDNIKTKYVDAKENKKLTKNWINYSFLISFLLAFVIMMIFIFIAPNYSSLRNYYALLMQNPTPETLQSASSFWFSPTSWFSSGVTNFTGGYIAIIVLFTLFMSYGIIGLLVNYWFSKIPAMKFNFSLSKEYFENLKKNNEIKKQEKIKIRQAQKMLEREENSLLRDLYKVNDEIKPETSGDISQEQLQDQIKKNNEIKKRLEELNKEKQNIRKQRDSLSKFKSALNQLNDKKNNLRTNQKEKQKITIPDKELDEIFKSLEID